MNHKLTEDDMKKIAHFVTQRNVVDFVAAGRSADATDRYIETFNQVMDKMEEYNKSIN